MLNKPMITCNQPVIRPYADIAIRNKRCQAGIQGPFHGFADRANATDSLHPEFSQHPPLDAPVELPVVVGGVGQGGFCRS